MQLQLAKNSVTGLYYSKKHGGFFVAKSDIDLTYLAPQEAAIVRASFDNVVVESLPVAPQKL